MIYNFVNIMNMITSTSKYDIIFKINIYVIVYNPVYNLYDTL